MLPNATALLLLAACDGAPKAPPPPPAPPASLVLVTLDTTRADRIGAYGYSLAATPTIDQLAREGLRFERAYATVPLTTPSHASMLTGLYPTRHGIRTNGDAILPEEIRTLAEVLQSAGWATGASVAAFVTTRIWNLDQGFDAYFDEVPPQVTSRWARERPANEVIDDAMAWLQELPDDQPFFLWVHVYDPHHPYAPPEAFRERMPKRPYDAELAFVDSELARLQPLVESKAGEGGAAWMIIADHGEALTEDRGEHTHGLFLFDETMRIPFIVRPPKALDAPLVVDTTVSNVDVTPTALALLGQSALPKLDGVDLTPALRGEPIARGGAYMESHTAAQRFGFAPERALAQGSLKLMHTPNPRLYDLAVDPGETENVYAARTSEAEALAAQVEVVLAAEVEREQVAMSSEVIDQLAALGYLSAGGTADLDSDIDAKDQAELLRRLEKARGLSRAEATRAEAVALYREILAEQPQLGDARTGLARVLEDQGELAEAEAVLAEAVETGSTVLSMSLARLLGKQGRFDDAVATLESVLAKVPGDEQAQLAMLRALPFAGRPEEALSRGLVWLEANPDSPALQSQVGVLLALSGDLERAEPLLQSSLEDGTARPHVLESLAIVARARGERSRALLLLEQELATWPRNPQARRALAELYMDAERWAEAAEQYARVLIARPADHDTRRAWAQAVFNTNDYVEAERILAPALEATPDAPHALLLQANIMAKTDRREEGEVLYKRAQKLYEAAGGPSR